MGTRDGGVDRVYLIVPTEVWTNSHLKLEEKVLFGRILYFTLKGDGALYETNSKLGRFLGRNDQTVRSYIKRLEKVGLIERLYEDGRRSLIANFDLIEDKGWHQVFEWAK